MTTISNFIQGNFIANSTSQHVEIPIWVINSNQSLPLARPILNAFSKTCQQDNKPLIHLDLGLHTISKIDKQAKQIVTQSANTYIKPYPLKPYYLVKASAQNKKEPHFLTSTIENISKDVVQGELRKDKQQLSAPNYEFGLLIEGIQAWCFLNKKQKHYSSSIQSFINHLSVLSPKIRQIIVYTESNRLPAEISFLLQRCSTCLTHVISRQQQTWKCLSTVRRYTGYNNQEQYNISVDQVLSRVKVVKNKVKKNVQRSKEQKEMVNSLGFSVEKDEQTRLKQWQLKQMIFPHLKMRNQNNGCEKESCGKDACKKECKSQPVPQDLFILDDQQQDDEDVDV